ncbi:hypothetical protein BJ138DRAFT_456462 [Hygrophoropsis aurantiaca]|uniref:Uncharacterized protein n=1 Tax=Hygrophoropsis aurantiaca TaxID=72124 RepID=A0ACB8A3W8_9AGAM|nr:hypothetical protein BJ138DRAFT_456462 [Hygrophoropsis aurantiaca]
MLRVRRYPNSRARTIRKSIDRVSPHITRFQHTFHPLAPTSSQATTLPVHPHVTPNPLPASFLRGGTSKGVFINRAHLPPSRADWGPIFLRLMGSPDPEYGRQLDGMGGGVSSLSKVCVVGRREEALDGTGAGSMAKDEIDAEYTFVQIGVRDTSVDYSGNCGNLTSMVGVFALDEGICARYPIPDGDTNDTTMATIKLYNTNTKKRIDTTFPVSLVPSSTPSSDPTPRPNPHYLAALDIPQTSISGVSGTASRITLDFLDPAGARTGRLLPSGNPVDVVDVTYTRDGGIEAHFNIPISLIDATNPTVFVAMPEFRRILAELGISPFCHSTSLPNTNTDINTSSERESSPPIPWSTPEITHLAELIRQAGARRMGLDPSAQAQPKIAFVEPANVKTTESPSTDTESPAESVNILAYSMQTPHRAVPLTVALALGVCVRVEGSVGQGCVRSDAELQNGEGAREQNGGAGEQLLRIFHPSGFVDVGAQLGHSDTAGAGEPHITSARVTRTGRRLMRGAVWW